MDIAGQMTLMDGGMAEMMGDGFDAESKIIAEQQEEEAKVSTFLYSKAPCPQNDLDIPTLLPV